MTDTRMEQIVGNLLRAGVILAAAVVLAGGIWYLAAQGQMAPSYHDFHGAHGKMPFTQGLPEPLAIVEIGLLLLVATPVARVVFCIAAFAAEHDRMYVTFTLVVLAILTYSLVMS